MKTILCIPGNWTDHDDLINSIAEKTKGEYIVEDEVLVNTKNETTFDLEIFESDETLVKAFEVAGEFTGMTRAEINAIKSHTFVLYLSCETGSPETAKELAFAARAIVSAGGTGVKVETSGKAFAPTVWAELIDDFEEENLYVLYVVDSIVNEEGDVYTCGMHNLGLRDSILYGLEYEDAIEVLSIFGYFLLLDKPVITENELFSEDEESPEFLIIEEYEQPHDGDEYLENPFGMWRLEPTE